MKKLLFVLCLLFTVVCVLVACESHTHTFADEWTSDATNHWHAASCEHTDEKADSAAHTWNDGEVTTAPTEAAEGVKTFTCTVCDATKTESVAKLTHTHVYGTGVVTAPTCTEAGYTTYTCACGETKTDTPVAALGHDWEIAGVGNGQHNLVCGNDSAHTSTVACDYEDDVTAPTCTTDGFTTHTCDCGHTYTDTTVPAGHDFGEWVADEEGHHTRVCSRDETHTETADCDYDEDEYDPTCTEDGYIEYVCVDCDYTYTEPTGELAIGHVDEDFDCLCDECDEVIFELTGDAEQTSDHVAAIVYGDYEYYYTSFDTAMIEALANGLIEIIVLQDASASQSDAKFISAGAELVITGANENVTLTVNLKGFQVYDGSLTIRGMKLAFTTDSIVYYAGAEITLENVDIAASVNCTIEASSVGATGATLAFIDCTITHATPDSGTAYIVYLDAHTTTFVVSNVELNAALFYGVAGANVNLEITDLNLTGSMPISRGEAHTVVSAIYGNDATAKAFGLNYRVGDTVGGAKGAVYFADEAAALAAAPSGVKVYDISGDEPEEVEKLCEHEEDEIIPAVDATCTETGLTEGKRCTQCGAVIVPQEEVPALGHVDEEDGDCMCDECGVCVLQGVTEQTADHVASITHNSITYYYESFDTAVVDALANGLTEIVVLQDTSATQNDAAKYIARGADLTIKGATEDVTLSVDFKGFQVFDASLTIKDLTLNLTRDDAIVFYLTAEITFDNVDILATGNCTIEASYDGNNPTTGTITMTNCTVTHNAPSATAYFVYVGTYPTTFVISDTTTNAAFTKAAAGGAVDMTVTNVTRTDNAEYVLANGCTNITINEGVPGEPTPEPGPTPEPEPEPTVVLTGATEQTAAHVASITYEDVAYYYETLDAAIVDALANDLPEVIVLKDASVSQNDAAKWIARGDDLTIKGATKAVKLTVNQFGLKVFDASLTIKDLTLALPAEDSMVFYLTAEITFDNVDIVEFGNCAIEASYDGNNTTVGTITMTNCTVTHKSPSATAYLVYVGTYTTTFVISDTTTNAAFTKPAANGTIDMTVTNVTLTDNAGYVLENGCTNITITDTAAQ